jgi:hypothetical protein
VDGRRGPTPFQGGFIARILAVNQGNPIKGIRENLPH